ncbi:hypothetical protein HWI79_654 [Cryptosporidium felis]|nr:hypothetical protein HWI79_654 [Cryptosporidium felis]
MENRRLEDGNFDHQRRPKQLRGFRIDRRSRIYNQRDHSGFRPGHSAHFRYDQSNRRNGVWNRRFVQWNNRGRIYNTGLYEKLNFKWLRRNWDRLWDNYNDIKLNFPTHPMESNWYQRIYYPEYNTETNANGISEEIIAQQRRLLASRRNNVCIECFRIHPRVVECNKRCEKCSSRFHDANNCPWTSCARKFANPCESCTEGNQNSDSNSNPNHPNPNLNDPNPNLNDPNPNDPNPNDPNPNDPNPNDPNDPNPNDPNDPNPNLNHPNPNHPNPNSDSDSNKVHSCHDKSVYKLIDSESTDFIENILNICKADPCIIDEYKETTLLINGKPFKAKLDLEIECYDCSQKGHLNCQNEAPFKNMVHKSFCALCKKDSHYFKLCSKFKKISFCGDYLGMNNVRNKADGHPNQDVKEDDNIECEERNEEVEKSAEHVNQMESESCTCGAAYGNKDCEGKCKERHENVEEPKFEEEHEENEKIENGGEDGNEKYEGDYDVYEDYDVYDVYGSYEDYDRNYEADYEDYKETGNGFEENGNYEDEDYLNGDMQIYQDDNEEAKGERDELDRMKTPKSESREFRNSHESSETQENIRMENRDMKIENIERIKTKDKLERLENSEASSKRYESDRRPSRREYVEKGEEAWASGTSYSEEDENNGITEISSDEVIYNKKSKKREARLKKNKLKRRHAESFSRNHSEKSDCFSELRSWKSDSISDEVETRVRPRKRRVRFRTETSEEDRFRDRIDDNRGLEARTKKDRFGLGVRIEENEIGFGNRRGRNETRFSTRKERDDTRERTGSRRDIDRFRIRENEDRVRRRDKIERNRLDSRTRNRRDEFRPRARMDEDELRFETRMRRDKRRFFTGTERHETGPIARSREDRTRVRLESEGESEFEARIHRYGSRFVTGAREEVGSGPTARSETESGLESSTNQGEIMEGRPRSERPLNITSGTRRILRSMDRDLSSSDHYSVNSRSSFRSCRSKSSIRTIRRRTFRVNSGILMKHLRARRSFRNRFLVFRGNTSQCIQRAMSNPG